MGTLNQNVVSVLSERIIREGSIIIQSQLAYQYFSVHTERHSGDARIRIDDSLNCAIAKVMSIQTRIQLRVSIKQRCYFHVSNTNTKSLDGTIGV